MFLDANQRHAAKLFLESFDPAARRKGRAQYRREDCGAIQLEVNGATVPLREAGDEPGVALRCEGTQWQASCGCKKDRCAHTYAAFMMLLRADDGDKAQGPAEKKEDPKTPLDKALQAKVGRKLNNAEAKYVALVQNYYRLVQKGGRLNKWDLENAFSFPVYNAAFDVPIDGGSGLTQLQFWHRLVLYLRRHKGKIPEALLPITDLREVEAAEEQERWEEQIDTWRETLSMCVPAAVPIEPEFLELRLCFEQTAAVLQGREDREKPFHTLKTREWEKISGRLRGGEVSLDAESLRIYSVFSSANMYGPPSIPYHDGPRTQMLRALFKAPELQERLVNAEGHPFRRSESRLHWQMTEKDGKYYQLSLAEEGGKVLDNILVGIPGATAFYLTPEAAYEGPRTMPSLGCGPHLIPAPALETAYGVNLLQSLGLELPPRLKERTRTIDMKVLLRCKIERAKYENQEWLHVEAVAVADEVGRVEKFTVAGWQSSVKAKPSNSKFFHVVRRGAMDLVPRTLEKLDLKWDAYGQGWHLRLGKNFPEKFLLWHSEVPADIELFLDRELATLTQDPIQAQVSLDCEEVGVDWFDLKTTVKVEDTTLTPEEIQLLLGARGKAVRLPGKGWRRLEYDISEEEEQSLARLGLSAQDFSAEPQRLHALQLADPAAEQMLAAEQFRKVQERAAEIKTRVTPDLPANITATLRPYQLEGYHFLAYLAENHFGGILADDMGLGKTVQTLTWLAWLNTTATERKPSLVVCPKSVVDNWRSEAIKFIPSLRVHLWNGNGNAEVENSEAGSKTAGQILTGAAAANDLLVLNYVQLRNLSAELSKVDFGAVILDEGQYIKNPDSQTAQAARALRTTHRLVLSGTPIENRLMDLWSLMQFAMPGVLGNRTSFKKRFDSASDAFARRRLASRVRPFLLRRTKTQVASDLPDRTEEEIVCEMEGTQKTLYRAEFKRAQQMLLKVKTQKELNEFRFNFLTSLLRLRQICCHPALIDDDYKQHESAKLNALLDFLEPLVEEGHKVLVFSQFVEMLQLIKGKLTEKEWVHYYLDGSSENRGELVDRFQHHEGSAIFLISLKAGGFGLNLTAASYVVIYDPWWNPAVENQAIDRTHRIGQTQKVIAYRLITKTSIEEKIRSLQKQKSAIAQDILGDEAFASSLTVDDLQYLFSDSPED